MREVPDRGTNADNYTRVGCDFFIDLHQRESYFVYEGLSRQNGISSSRTADLFTKGLQ